MQTHAHRLIHRHPGNPILDASMWPYATNSTFNPAATLVGEETLLLVRVEDRTGISHLSAARSPDGVTNWRIDPQPALVPDPKHHPEEVWGIEDARITRLEEMGEWAIAYTACSRGGPLVSLACTDDFRRFPPPGTGHAPRGQGRRPLPPAIQGKMGYDPPPR